MSKLLERAIADERQERFQGDNELRKLFNDLHQRLERVETSQARLASRLHRHESEGDAA